MARTKKRYLETPQIEEIQKKSPIIYHAGIYVRLSHERTETYRNKSSSISIQEEVCIEFAKKKELQLKKHIATMSIQVQILSDPLLRK